MVSGLYTNGRLPDDKARDWLMVTENSCKSLHLRGNVKRGTNRLAWLCLPIKHTCNQSLQHARILLPKQELPKRYISSTDLNYSIILTMSTQKSILLNSVQTSRVRLATLVQQ